MSPQDVIREVKSNAAEWLEMSEDPASMVAGILANKVIELKEHIVYLERRLNHGRKTS
jgi:hypothetical protein